MVLAVFFGSGRAAREVFNLWDDMPPDAIKVSLSGAGDWLRELEPGCVRLSPADLRGIADFIRERNVTEACFVGPVYRSIGWPMVFRAIRVFSEAVRFLTLHRKVPHSVLKFMLDFFEHQRVAVAHLRDFLPGLVGRPGESLGPPIHYPLAELVRRAKDEGNDPKKWNRYWVAQSFIYRRLPDAQEFELLDKEAFNTDKLIAKVRNIHRLAAPNATYVLVKVSLDALGSIDSPVLGEDTVRNCIESGISAIVAEADQVLLFQRDAVAALCAQHSLSVLFA